MANRIRSFMARQDWVWDFRWCGLRGMLDWTTWTVTRDEVWIDLGLVLIMGRWDWAWEELEVKQ